MAAMIAASTGLKAQEVTVVLTPGWTWISCPTMDTLDFATAMDSFTPISGDIIMSKWGVATYTNGRWRGTISQFFPGNGYMYYSSRTMPVFLTFNAQQPLQVAVTTMNPTAITTYGMTCGGEVINSGNSGVLVRGVCWSTQQNPTINDPHTTDGYGMGSFTSTVEGLEMNSTYYVRAYALTANGAGYGEQVMFTTKNGVPTLTTSAASEIGVTWATCGGDISDDGGMEVTERGICWSTTSNPTIEGNHGSNGAGLGSFSVNMNGLEANTTYYVRAYATNGYTTAYGNEISFRTEVAQTWPNGKLPGQFSVSETHQVQFSQGNLQYIGSAATPYWRFAEHQYDYFGTTTGQNSNAQDVDRDLFGWGTSGWDNGNLYYQPYDVESFWDSNAGYGYGPTDGTNYNYNLTGDYANADWGVYNAILNGGNVSHQWRTLTRDEWNYMLNTRTTASGIRYSKAQVFGVNGVVLLPDDWDESIYALNYCNNTDTPFNSNVIADADWATMETNGAVFLPAAGYRSGTSVYNVSSSGFYWQNTSYSYGQAYYINFYDSYLSPHYVDGRYYGRSVRLVSVALPEVSIGTVNDVSGRAAIVSGNVTEDGNADISACGLCCSISSNPTTDNMVVLAQNTTIGEFTVTLNGLTPNTTYYARAFATNSAGTVYSDEISFTTLDIPTWANGILPGGFSVSANQQVQFSQGNLQYIGSAATPYWHFAENQWDYLGTTTGQNSSNENVDRDLFGWGTSGYNHGAICYQPWSTSRTDSDYYAYGSSTYNLNDSTGMADWGYNAISNGGNQENQWRTLTYYEWNYIFNSRSTASGIRFAKAHVFGVDGIILLPDDWDASYYSLNSPNYEGANYTSNMITAIQWVTLEQHGAVFLPAAGFRIGTSVSNVGSYAWYWSASCNGTYASGMFVYDNSVSTGENYRYVCQSVRLVHSIPVYSIEATPNPAEGGTVTGQGNYNSDATCTLTATPNEGYIFTSWTENGEVVSTEITYSFTVTSDRTLVANFLQGAINGKFTINDSGDQVYFSQGNLQYQASTETWRFAENQWDYVGTQNPPSGYLAGGTVVGSDNSNISQTYSGWIDLFGWGTSGWDNGNEYYQPWDSQNNGNSNHGFGYGPTDGTNYSWVSLTGVYSHADWGVHNAISNGESVNWRTLEGGYQTGEWNYVINARNASTVNGVVNARYAKAKVANVPGLILFPDSYTHPSEVAQPIGINETGNEGWNGNNYSETDFVLMQTAGAVFLPAAGYRDGTSVKLVSIYGDYWSASGAVSQAWHLWFYSNDVTADSGNNNYRYYGQSVRLVCPVQ